MLLSMISILSIAGMFGAVPLPLAVTTLWYAVPLIVSVSLVCAATRHELMKPIMGHAMRFSVWVLVFMAIFVGLLALLEHMA
jgi:hypothetical protein